MHPQSSRYSSLARPSEPIRGSAVPAVPQSLAKAPRPSHSARRSVFPALTRRRLTTRRTPASSTRLQVVAVGSAVSADVANGAVRDAQPRSALPASAWAAVTDEVAVGSLAVSSSAAAVAALARDARITAVVVLEEEGSYGARGTGWEEEKRALQDAGLVAVWVPIRETDSAEQVGRGGVAGGRSHATAGSARADGPGRPAPLHAAALPPRRPPFSHTTPSLALQTHSLPPLTVQAAMLPQAVRVVAALAAMGHRVLLRCPSAARLSPLIALGYLVLAKGMPVSAALAVVKESKPNADPPVNVLMEARERLLAGMTSRVITIAEAIYHTRPITPITAITTITPITPITSITPITRITPITPFPSPPSPPSPPSLPSPVPRAPAQPLHRLLLHGSYPSLHLLAPLLSPLTSAIPAPVVCALTHLPVPLMSARPPTLPLSSPSQQAQEQCSRELFDKWLLADVSFARSVAQVGALCCSDWIRYSGQVDFQLASVPQSAEHQVRSKAQEADVAAAALAERAAEEEQGERAADPLKGLFDPASWLPKPDPDQRSNGASNASDSSSSSSSSSSSGDSSNGGSSAISNGYDVTTGTELPSLAPDAPPELQEANARVESLSAQLAEAREWLAELEASSSQVLADVASRTAEIEALKRREALWEEELEAAKVKETAMREQLRVKQTGGVQQVRVLGEVEEEISALKLKVAEGEERNAEVEKEIGELRAQVDEAKGQLRNERAVAEEAEERVAAANEKVREEVERAARARAAAWTAAQERRAVVQELAVVRTGRKEAAARAAAERIEELQVQAGLLAERVKQAEVVSTEADSRAGALEAQMAVLVSRTAAAQQRASAAAARVTFLSGRFNSLEMTAAEAARRAERVESEVVHLRGRDADAAAAVAANAEAISRLSLEVSRLSLEVSRLSLEVSRLSLEVSRLSLEVSRLSLEVRRLSLEVSRLSLEAMHLKDSEAAQAQREAALSVHLPAAQQQGEELRAQAAAFSVQLAAMARHVTRLKAELDWVDAHGRRREALSALSEEHGTDGEEAGRSWSLSLDTDASSLATLSPLGPLNPLAALAPLAAVADAAQSVASSVGVEVGGGGGGGAEGNEEWVRREVGVQGAAVAAEGELEGQMEGVEDPLELLKVLMDRVSEEASAITQRSAHLVWEAQQLREELDAQLAQQDAACQVDGRPLREVVAGVEQQAQQQQEELLQQAGALQWALGGSLALAVVAPLAIYNSYFSETARSNQINTLSAQLDAATQASRALEQVAGETEAESVEAMERLHAMEAEVEAQRAAVTRLQSLVPLVAPSVESDEAARFCQNVPQEFQSPITEQICDGLRQSGRVEAKRVDGPSGGSGAAQGGRFGFNNPFNLGWKRW
ncbi:unnamed protein product [Closterium sp. NIES-65]|nr:unnamed protein product [Closterium sp. NIES-65]